MSDCQNLAPCSEHLVNGVGPQVQAIRLSKGLTQDVVTAKCNLLDWSISRGTYAKIESKSRRVTDDELAKLSQALDVPIAALYPPGMVQ